MSLDWNHGVLAEGMRCFDRGEFFAAHEHWELIWLASQEPEKTFLQALIQIAASFHHFQRGNLAGSTSLLRAALRRLQRYPEDFAGIAVAPLRLAIHSWIEVLACDAHASPPPIPRISRSQL